MYGVDKMTAMLKITKGVYTVSNFLRPDECEKLIIQGEEKGFEEATISFPQQPKMMRSARNNDRVTFESVDLANALFPRIAPHLHQILPSENADSLNPRFRFYRYYPGQRFKRHIDGTVNSNDLESKLTFLIYLNDDCGGGETIFRPRGVPEGGDGEYTICGMRELRLSMV